MNKSKLKFVQDELLNWFINNQRIYPWRKNKMTSYQYIIAEVLLQRTKAETISNYYPKFIQKYPNWKRLNQESEIQLSDFLKPIGLFRQRASRLKKLAFKMVELKYALPGKKEDLEKMPFFGQYIVNAVILFIYNKPAPLLDVNMSRVLERIFGERKLADIRYDPFLQNLAHQYVSHEEPIKLNWAILDFAAIICKPEPKCFLCPLTTICLYYKANAIIE